MIYISLLNLFFIIYIVHFLVAIVYVFSVFQSTLSPNIQGAKLKLKIKNSSDVKNE